MSDSRKTFRFRDCELDVAAYELRRQGRSVRLERQPMDVLILLVQRRGQLVSRADIVDALWGKNVFVEVETGVHTAIRKIRRALHDSPQQPRFVETVSRKGYRFVAPVEIVYGTRLAPPVRLAVLRFENLSGDPERDYLADGLAEETIGALGNVDPEHIEVVARTSTMVYKRGAKAVERIGQDLRVDYLVEGSVRADGSRLRVTSRLIRVRDQVQAWSESYDREATRILDL
jgi:TolB-like protein/DNA-binding winged helix-turn-helix (wHTH) protein